MADSTAGFFYFAYGSNMASRRLTAANRAPSARRLATGYVTGRRLAFDKYSSRDKSAKCDCEATCSSLDRVYGVIYEIDLADRHLLDAAEGLHHGYRDEILEVITPDAVYEALAYIATDKRPNLAPYDWYLEHVVRGALENELPASYVEAIRQVRVIPDANAARAASERAVYQCDTETRETVPG